MNQMALSIDLKEQQALVDRCKEGELSGFKQLYNQYSKAMFNTSLRIVNNYADAEDVLQESFVEVYRKLYQFDGRATIGAWIKRIVVNKSIDHIRKKRDYLVEEPELRVESVVDETASDVDHLTVDGVMQAIEQLAPGYRTVYES